MENISEAACTLGLIAFSLENSLPTYVAPTQLKHEGGRWLATFIAAIEILGDILEALDTSTRDPMKPLSSAFNNAAENCAVNLLDIECQIRELMGQGQGAWLARWNLGEEKLKEFFSVLNSHIRILRPYVDLLPSRQPAIGVSNQSSSILDVIFPPLGDMQDRIQVFTDHGKISTHVYMLLGEVQSGKIGFSRRQQYQLLKLLTELDRGLERIRADNGNDDIVSENMNQETTKAEYIRQNWDTEYSQLYELISDCRNRLSNLARSVATDMPSVRAREAIIALQQLNTALPISSESLTAASESKTDEKATQISPSRGGLPEVRRVKFMQAGFKLKVLPYSRQRGLKRPNDFFICGRAAERPQKYSVSMSESGCLVAPTDLKPA